MAILNKILPLVPVLMWKEMQEAGYSFDQPFQVELDKQEFFYAEHVVRMIPKKRIVAFGHWNGKPAVIKLFFDRRYAQRHAESDAAGIKGLQVNNIPAPAIYYHGTAKDKRVQALIFERIEHAVNLDEIWKDKTDAETLMPIMKSVIIEIATQHVLGVIQKDLHLKNFLVTEKSIYTLDGAQIELLSTLLPKKQSMENLALFFSQLGAGAEAMQKTLFYHYAKARGWLLKEEDVADLFHLIQRYNRERWERYEKKIFRDSSDFMRIRRMKASGMVKRRYLGPDMQAFLREPEQVFSRQDKIMLKDGRSSTVIRVTLDGREYVIKRYNLKHLWHRLRRSLRSTRAQCCWHLSQKLELFHIATAKPVAYLERRVVGLRGKSYFVTEYVRGEHIGKYFLSARTNHEAASKMARRVAELLKNLTQLEITHGDLKAANILVDSQQRPVLIDLDGAREHFSLNGLRQSWKTEVKRFLKNFDNLPSVKTLIMNALR